MHRSYLKTIFNSTLNTKFIIFILIQFLPLKELNSEEWEENKLNIKFIQNLNVTNSPKWEKIEINEEKYQQKIIWDKIEIKNDFIREDYNPNKDSNKLLERSRNSEDLTLGNKFRSVSRNLIYKGNLYPEMSFWIPSSFKHSKRFTYTLTGQLLGNPTHRSHKDDCTWDEFWTDCADSQFFFEATPVNTKYFSLGLNYSQQESFLGNRADGTWRDAGQAIGFQLKTNLNSSQGFSIIGNNLYNPYGKGGPNNKHPKPGETVQADLGRSYLFLYSKAWDLGKHFNSNSHSLMNINAGFGNGRYKSAKEIETNWINLGKYEPIFSFGIALNKKFSIFTEYAGQYAGVGISLRPVNLPLTATFMLRDFQGSNQGIINCKNGDPENCRATIDTRLVFHF